MVDPDIQPGTSVVYKTHLQARAVWVSGAFEGFLIPERTRLTDHVTVTPSDQRALEENHCRGAVVAQDVYMVRIDVAEPNLAFIVTPDNGPLPGETSSFWTSSFLKKVQCQVAINANPFAPVHLSEGQPQDVLGLLVDDGNMISPAQESLPALLIGSDHHVSIAGPPFDLSAVQYAVGGFSVVLEQGRIIGQDQPLHPRTAAGVSQDGRYLYLLVIDGRQPGYSEGASTAEIAAWLKRLGASDGINLDGGGTSTLVMTQPDGSVAVINRPIHRGVPGLERGGAHLGIRALPLKMDH